MKINGMRLICMGRFGWLDQWDYNRLQEGSILHHTWLSSSVKIASNANILGAATATLLSWASGVWLAAGVGSVKVTCLWRRSTLKLAVSSELPATFSITFTWNRCCNVDHHSWVVTWWDSGFWTSESLIVSRASFFEGYILNIPNFTRIFVTCLFF